VRATHPHHAPSEAPTQGRVGGAPPPLEALRRPRGTDVAPRLRDPPRRASLHRGAGRPGIGGRGGAIATPAWVRDGVFYQISPDRFARSERVVPPGPYEPWDSPPTRHGFKGGDLYGIAERLDYLADLGVTALYLNPIFSSASNHRYHTFDYFEVDPLLGGDQALDELLHAAHGRWMRVLLE